MYINRIKLLRKSSSLISKTQSSLIVFVACITTGAYAQNTQSSAKLDNIPVEKAKSKSLTFSSPPPITFPPNTLYTGDGALISPRTVLMHGNNITFKAFDDTPFFINGMSGNTGIGTNTPTHELEVEGTTFARKSIIEHALPNGYIFTDSDEKYEKGIVLSAGGVVNAETKTRTFEIQDFPVSNLDDKAYTKMYLEDRNNMARLRHVFYTASSSFFDLNDREQRRVFGVYENNEFVNVTLPKEDSQINIGGEGSFPTKYRLNVYKGDTHLGGNVEIDGIVGIGVEPYELSDDPEFRLYVKDGIRTEEVRVDFASHWPDYVFESSYELPSLASVEDYIKHNGHLMNIPSAKEVETQGFKLGQMSGKLLEKIEELTLYTIDQENELDQLSDENKSLREELKLQKELLNDLTQKIELLIKNQKNQ